ncbi:glycosyltransferase [Litorivicinus sp.]|nr:glycosyltransferase [Litorivicinus sp.]
MAVYNGSEWLQTQVESIVNQKGVELKVFISIDLSADNSLEVCKELANCYDCISILPYGDRYGGAAKNFFRLIKDVNVEGCDYISFSDQDDIWFDSKLINAIEIIEKRKIHAYSGDVTAVWADGRQMRIIKSQPQRRFDYIFESAGPGCTFVFKKCLAKKFKNFLFNKPEAMEFVLHDWLLYGFARSHGFLWHIDPRANMFYRQHGNNQVGVNNSFFSLWKRFMLLLNGSVGKYVNQLLELISYNSIDKLPSKIDLNGYFFFIRNWRDLRRRTRDRYFVLVALIFMILLYYPFKLVKYKQ